MWCRACQASARMCGKGVDGGQGACRALHAHSLNALRTNVKSAEASVRHIDGIISSMQTGSIDADVNWSCRVRLLIQACLTSLCALLCSRPCGATWSPVS
jgi:hypothetical protein